MKLFLIYASAGFGHKKIAEAINEAVKSSLSSDSVFFIDLLEFTSPLFKLLYSKGYIFLISKLSWLWAIFFFLSDTKYLKLINDNFRRFNNEIYCHKFLNFIKEQNPDIIISTHFLVNELVSSLKERSQIKSKLISVITDFGVHNFWLAKNIDMYSVACNQTKEILLSKQVNEEKIKVLGMPARRQFYRQIDKKQVIQKLEIKNEGFTVLILTGGIGIGPIYDIVRILSDAINVIVICGKNEKLFNQLRKLNYKKLVVLGWIDYVEEVMAISDIIITKPGGSTISECLIMGLPMIFFSIIPGQESQNATIVSGAGLGFILKWPKEIKNKVLYFKDNPSELNAIRDRINKFKIKDSSQKILQLLNE